MPTEAQRLRFGYWPSRQLAGESARAIREIEEYDGSEVLNIACTQTGLPASQQNKLVNRWVQALPDIPAKTIEFSSKVSNKLFKAACSAPNLEALSIKWSSIDSLEPIERAKQLRAFFLGSSPSIVELAPLTKLKDLRWLFLENLEEPVNLSFLRELSGLKEFGVSATRGKKLKVCSLEPISHLKELEMLWLVSITIENGGLIPLHALRNLQSLRSTIRPKSQEFKDLCSAAPSIKYFQPVG
jgi:hypothetical protein